MLVLEQIVEGLSAGVFRVGLGAYSAGAFDHVAHLEKIAEVGLLLVLDKAFDILPALSAAGGIKMSAAPTTSQLCQAVLAFVITTHLVYDTGRSAATPADQSIIGHLFLQSNPVVNIGVMGRHARP